MKIQPKTVYFVCLAVVALLAGPAIDGLEYLVQTNSPWIPGALMMLFVLMVCELDNVIQYSLGLKEITI